MQVHQLITKLADMIATNPKVASMTIVWEDIEGNYVDFEFVRVQPIHINNNYMNPAVPHVVMAVTDF